MARTPTRTTAVAKKEEDQVAALWGGEGEDTGFEGTGADDYALPFLKLLQKTSPECDEDDAAFVKGAKPGMYFDTSTQELLEEVDVVPCHQRRAMVEWHPREEGGGFVAQHDVGAEAGLDRDDAGRWDTGNGTYLADTRYFFCLRLTEAGPAPVIISFTSTQLKKARTWMTKMRSIKLPSGGQAPMWSSIWHLGAVGESNDKGTWKGYKIERSGWVSDPQLKAAAEEARDMFADAAANVKPPVAAGGGEGDEIPF